MDTVTQMLRSLKKQMEEDGKLEEYNRHQSFQTSRERKEEKRKQYRRAIRKAEKKQKRQWNKN